jgi:PAS domain S-box-containing protein
MSVDDLRRKLEATNEALRQEIVERKRAAMALQQSEERYRGLVEVSPDAIVQVDTNAVIRVVNQQTVTLLGFTRADEIVGHSAFEFIVPEDHPQAQADLRQTLQAGTMRNLEYQLVQKDGGRIAAELNAQLVVDSAGMPQAVIAVVRDITERKHVESERARLFEQLQRLSRQLLQAHEAERRSIARELHDEIGQQLTGLGLLLTTTSQRLPPDMVPAPLVEAQARVRELIVQVQNLALDLRPAVLDDFGLVPALVWLFERYTAQTNIAVRFEHRLREEQRFDPEVETTAYRIVQEALTNVARHAGMSEVTIQLWTNDDIIFVVASDQGRGFDPRTVRQRASSGLAGMRERAALLGGSLTIESAVGAGTRLTATLPLRGGAGSREQEQGT